MIALKNGVAACFLPRPCPVAMPSCHAAFCGFSEKTLCCYTATALQFSNRSFVTRKNNLYLYI
ncbi:MAG: hypothetical protein IJ693_03100, partial [Bacteroidaceae bacterium]|nr:hypothetical protein [Bacteroidaceae bacterium]